MYRIGICDDEVLQVKVNAMCITESAKKQALEIDTRGFTQAEALVTYIENEGMDILFLDIDMGQVSGIALASQVMALNPQIIIVFVTSHREFALDAFDIQALGYLVKPIAADKLDRVLQRAIQQVDANKYVKSRSEIILTVDHIKKKVYLEDIHYIERQQAKSVFYLKGSRVAVYESMTAIAQRLDVSFLRISQSVIVNLDQVDTIRYKQVILKSGLALTIGRTYAKAVNEGYYGISRGNSS